MSEAPLSSTETPNSALRAWPFEEARKVQARLAASGKQEALFETGYGPSGLPHIGTFGEVARTSWVRRAFTELTGLPSRLIAFSDDMDGLRKVPDNVPNREMLAQYLGKPLTRIPDPFGTHPSFGAHNNARLQSFLDSFGFEYEFASSSEYYATGRFDAALLDILRRHDEIVAVIKPTLGAERQATYSPFLPVHPRTGVVMQVRIDRLDPDAGTLSWTDPETGERFETPVTGGAVKCQWKADWAMRWHALGVDYEMSGKDLIDSVRLSGRICRILGSEPPVGFTYELFLDEQAQKISKSKGNGLSVEEWLRYAPPESLGQFMFNQPQRAKRLYFDVIPKAVDEYLANATRAHAMPEAERPGNATWHIHAGQVPQSAQSPLSFAMLLNLASVVNAETPDILWGFIRRYNPAATPEDMPFLARLVEYALAYYRDFVAPAKSFRDPNAVERAALEDLLGELKRLAPDTPAEEIQNILYAVGKRHPFGELRAFFACLYQVLLGQQDGPRFGQFIALYGVRETEALIEQALSRGTA
ncbi:MAG TPA: lysine--tRNA ligase [Acetobacteraceae bacterium]